MKPMVITYGGRESHGHRKRSVDFKGVEGVLDLEL